jgi:predicted nucleic-acid-binding Zn-ribbon protein
MASIVAKCPRCEYTCEFRHMHDTAHGIEGTHMSGSERFTCTQCGNSVFHTDEAAKSFTFILDGVDRDGNRLLV